MNQTSFEYFSTIGPVSDNLQEDFRASATDSDEDYLFVVTNNPLRSGLPSLVWSSGSRQLTIQTDRPQITVI